MTDTTYYIRTPDLLDIVAEYVSGGPAAATRGETSRYEFTVQDSVEDLTVSGSHTVASGTVEEYGAVTIEAGATLTVAADARLQASSLTTNGTLDNDGTVVVQAGKASPFSRLREYADYAGSYASLDMLDGTQKYREHVPSGADVSSILLGVEPAQDLQNRDIQGVWGVVARGQDERPAALSVARFTLEVEVLADYGDYADHAAVRAALEV